MVQGEPMPPKPTVPKGINRGQYRGGRLGNPEPMPLRILQMYRWMMDHQIDRSLWILPISLNKQNIIETIEPLNQKGANITKIMNNNKI